MSVTWILEESSKADLEIYQQDAAGALQLLHGRVQIAVSHMRELVNSTVDEEAFEASHSGLDHGPKLKL